MDHQTTAHGPHPATTFWINKYAGFLSCFCVNCMLLQPDFPIWLTSIEQTDYVVLACQAFQLLTNPCNLSKKR